MKTRLTRLLALLAAGLAPVFAVYGDAFTKNDGTSFEGRIYKVLDGSVYLRVGEERINAPIGDFDAASQGAIESWVAENPQAVDVYTKWDVQPRIKSSSMPNLPDQFLSEDFKGMVSVDLVLNESGQVIHASVKKSTHSELEPPSLEAAKTWIFEPAQVGGKSVKSKLRVPFKFVYTPPAPDEAPAS
ncbi:TonB family C-terminal domain protein [Verrucomicrobiia bacterium DG1235]|nr:TonB family C-terminal domain protein [Verrucomicrobiae bacterium DG1235]